MKFKNKYSLNNAILKLSGRKFENQVFISGVSDLNNIEHGELNYIAHERFLPLINQFPNNFFIVKSGLRVESGQNYIVSQNPEDLFNNILLELVNEKIIPQNKDFLYKFAYIDANNKIAIDKSSAILNNCNAGNFVSIGKNTVVHKNVTIGHNTTLGGDPFYFYNTSVDVRKPFTVLGGLIIEENVWIGSNVTINRGWLGNTIIGKNTIIDSNVHIGHDVKIGENCLIAAQTGISGNSRIGSHCKLWGQVGISQNIEIGAHSNVYAKSAVTKSWGEKSELFGNPGRPLREELKNRALLRRLSFKRNQ